MEKKIYSRIDEILDYIESMGSFLVGFTGVLLSMWLILGLFFLNPYYILVIIFSISLYYSTKKKLTKEDLSKHPINLTCFHINLHEKAYPESNKLLHLTHSIVLVYTLFYLLNPQGFILPGGFHNIVDSSGYIYDMQDPSSLIILFSTFWIAFFFLPFTIFFSILSISGRILGLSDTTNFKDPKTIMWNIVSLSLTVLIIIFLQYTHLYLDFVENISDYLVGLPGIISFYTIAKIIRR